MRSKEFRKKRKRDERRTGKRDRNLIDGPRIRGDCDRKMEWNNV